MTQDINEFFKNLWEDYTSFNPHALEIYNLFVSRGENVINDHIALRTFDDPKVNIDALSKKFLELGYEEKGQYNFEQKKLFAKHFEHPEEKQPKVFISQLLTSKFSEDFQNTIKELIEQVPENISNQEDFAYCGRPWTVSHETYVKLLKESEYGAWMAAFGYRPNHFTVFFNHLKSFQDLNELNAFLKESGFALNSSGGEIKGSPEVYLEQSSTLAGEVEIDFSDGKFKIPACYYEFARRYPLENGKLYTGFVTNSADKIFESTNRQAC